MSAQPDTMGIDMDATEIMVIGQRARVAAALQKFRPQVAEAGLVFVDFADDVMLAVEAFSSFKRVVPSKIPFYREGGYLTLPLLNISGRSQTPRRDYAVRRR